MLETLEDWTSAVDQGYGVDVVYLNYSKAFDSVPHRRLISKLEAYGVRGNLSLWLSNFLTNCFQRVVVNGSQSDWVGIQSRVPQGSVLGPLLFILYVNNVPDLIESNLKMFADDTKIYLVIKSFYDSLKLQHDINKLMQWSSVWLLRFNAAKCKVMQIDNSLPASYTMYDGTTNVSTDLELVNEELDLGVWCTSNLKPSLHYQKAAVKATQVLGLIITQGENSINPLSIRDLLQYEKYRNQLKKPRPILVKLNHTIDGVSLLIFKAKTLHFLRISRLNQI